MLPKRLLGIVLACALLLCGCMTGEHSPKETPVLDTPDARAAFTREAMMFTEMLFAGLPCEGTVTENGVQYPVVAHEQYPTYQSLVDALNWYFDPALAGALKEAMPYAEVQGKPVKTGNAATAGAQFDKATVTADSAEGLTLNVPSSQGDLTVSITLKDGRISGYTGAGHPTDTAAIPATGTYNGEKITMTMTVTDLNYPTDSYDWPLGFVNGYAPFAYYGKVGEESKYIGHTFIDKTGKVYTEPKYHMISYFNEDGVALAGIALDHPENPSIAKEFEYYLLDTTGNATRYTSDISAFEDYHYDSRAPWYPTETYGYTVRQEMDDTEFGKYYIEDGQGNSVRINIDKIMEAYIVAENAVVCYVFSGESLEESTACLVDMTGKQISPTVGYIGYFENGLAAFVQDGKTGLMADTGEIIVPATLPLTASFYRMHPRAMWMYDGVIMHEEDGRLVIVEITRQFADMQGTALTAAQKEEIQQFLNATENNGFIVGNYYSYPEKISLYRAFRDGAGVGTFGATDWSEQEKQDVLAATGWPEYRNPPLKITASAVKQVLQEKLGLTQDQIQDDLSEHFRYVKAYDAYYTMHGDTEFVRVTVTGGRVDSDNVYVVAYTYGTDFEDKAVVTLRKTATGYQFISNVEDDREQPDMLTATGTYNGQKITMTMTVTDLNYPIDPYDWPRYFVNGYAPFAYYGKVGEENKYIGHTFIDKTGKVYTEPKYHVMSYFNEDGVALAGMALDHPDDPSMATKYEYYLLDTAGNATPCASEPEDILWHGSPGTRSLGNGYALRNEADENAVVGTKYYIADSLGNVVYTFESHTLEVQAAGENAVVCWVGDDSSGKVVACMRDVTGKQISPVVDHIGTFKDGLAAFAQDGKVGLIADTGEIVIPATFPLTAQFTVAGVTRSLIMGLNGMMFAEHDGRVAIVEITRE